MAETVQASGLMNVLPVITRELRAEARNPFNHWIRISGAALVLVVAGIGLIEQRKPDGAPIFSLIHTTLLLAIWVLVPLITADCVARERREGTLGLLFLTPLKPIEIIIGKSIVHMSRAFTFWLAAIPIVVIPLLLGGVAWLDIYTAFAFQFCSVLLALASGLIASSIGNKWGRTLLLAEIVAVFMALLFMTLLVFALVCVAPQAADDLARKPLETLIVGGAFLANGVPERGWSRFMVGPLGGQLLKNWPWFVTLTLLGSIAVFVVALRISKRLVSRNWQQEPPSAAQARLFQAFCTPQFWRSIFRNRMRRALDRNPIGWLQQYSWSARLIKWSWCLGIVVVETVAIYACDWRDLAEAQLWVALALLAGVSFSSAASFRRERETGALELLLVTPLTEREIIWGRLRGIYSQFAIAIAVLMISWIAVNTGAYRRHQPTIETVYWLMIIHFGTVPLVGLYFSLRSKHLLVGCLLTWIFGIVVPLLIYGAALWVGFFFGSGSAKGSLIAMYIIVQAVVFLCLHGLLARLLLQRRFALHV